MKEERCESCRFFNKSDETKGDCRRNPPQVVIHHGEITEFFPIVSCPAWCGEYQRKEEGK